MKPGTEVSTDYRCPMDSAHPDCWKEPWKGIVLANNDPRAWAGTVAMAYDDNPSQERVDAHLADLAEREIEQTSIAVLYDFDGNPAVHWEPADKVKPYADVLREWHCRRQQEYQKRTVTKD